MYFVYLCLYYICRYVDIILDSINRKRNVIKVEFFNVLEICLCKQEIALVQ